MSIYSKAYNPYSPFNNNFDVWDPYLQHHDQYDHRFGSPNYYAAVSHPVPFSYKSTVVPLVNTEIEWKETPEAHIFKVDLPVGLTKDEVKVELEEGNVICISGEKIMEKEEKAEHWYHLERSGGKFVRSFKLPQNAKAKDMMMKACMENGVLTITIPKKDMNEDLQNHPRWMKDRN